MNANGNRSLQIEEAIALSRDMLAAAQENAWERVAEIDAQRRMLVMQCFHRPTPEQDASAVATAIREILALNHHITKLGKVQRQVLGDKLHTNRMGRIAQEAYLRCALSDITTIG